jgi:hypothetical protein
VSASLDELGEPLRLVETDSTGVAQLELAWSAVAPGSDGSRRWVWLRSGGPGLLTRIELTPAPTEPGGSVSLRIQVVQGAVVEGRIMGPDGQPAAGRVGWWFFGEEGITRSPLGTAGPDGLFRGELRYQGTHGLLALGTSQPVTDEWVWNTPHRMDLGTGFSELFEVSFTEPVPFLEVRLSGPGLLQGRVLDDTGAPAAGIPLAVVLAELDDEDGSLSFPFPRNREVEQEGRGNHWMQAVTDDNGNFVFRGLRDGLFNVRTARGGDTDLGYGNLLTELPVPSHGKPLELHLARPHLAIHVRQPDGSLPETELGVHRSDPRSSTLHAWPEEPGVLVTLSPGSAHIGQRGAYLTARASGPGEFIVELEDELTQVQAGDLGVDVGVLGGALAWSPVHVDVPVGAGRVDVDLVLPGKARSGTLVLDAVDDGGAALVVQLRVRVSDLATGVVLLDKSCTDTDGDDWPARLQLPEGEYRLLVEGHPWIVDHNGTILGTILHRRVHGAFEVDVRISSLTETRVTATLGAASRLRVSVAGTVSEADREAVRAEQVGFPSEMYVDIWAPHVQLRLERDGRWPERPLFARSAMGGTPSANIHLFSSLVMGSEETSEPLTPGAYTLVATTPGGRELRRPVVFVPGETLSVTLQFD